MNYSFTKFLDRRVPNSVGKESSSPFSPQRESFKSPWEKDHVALFLKNECFSIVLPIAATFSFSDDLFSNHKENIHIFSSSY